MTCMYGRQITLKLHMLMTSTDEIEKSYANFFLKKGSKIYSLYLNINFILVIPSITCVYLFISTILNNYCKSYSCSIIIL